MSDEVIPPELLPQAVAELADSEGWRAALALETAHWDVYVHSHPEALLASLTALPGEAFVEVPSLLVAVNYLQHLITGATPTRFHDVAHDERDHPVENRQPLDLLIAITGRIAGLRTDGRFKAAAHAAAEGRQTLEQLSAQQRAPLNSALPHLLAQWGRALEMNDSGGVLEYEESWQLASLTGQNEIARRAASSLAWLHTDHGRLNEADRWIARALATESVGVRYDAPLYLALAMTAGDRLDLLAVNAHLDALQSVPIGEYWAAEAWVRAWLVRSEKDLVRVENLVAEQLLRHSDRTGSKGANHRYLTTARASLATARGRPLAAPSDAKEPTSLGQILMAAADYRSGSMRQVLRHAASANDADASIRMRIAAHLLTAAARLSLGREDAAADAFVSAHTLIEEERLYSSYGMIADEHRDALALLTNLELHTAVVSSPRGEQSTSSAALASLTRRERQMLSHLASDESLKSIAEAMFVSPNTVKSLTSRLYRKLDVHSRREAAAIAQSAGLA